MVDVRYSHIVVTAKPTNWSFQSAMRSDIILQGTRACFRTRQGLFLGVT